MGGITPCVLSVQQWVTNWGGVLSPSMVSMKFRILRSVDQFRILTEGCLQGNGRPQTMGKANHKCIFFLFQGLTAHWELLKSSWHRQLTFEVDLFLVIHTKETLPSASKSLPNIETFSSKSEQKLHLMTKLHLPNLHQTVVSTFLIINMSNSNNLNKFWVVIFTSIKFTKQQWVSEWLS